MRTRAHSIAQVIVVATLAAAVTPVRADDEDPSLKIVSQGLSTAWRRSDLVKRPDLERIDLDDGTDEAYPCQDLHYEAIRMTAVLEPFKIDPGAVLEIMGKDRYVSRIPYSELRNTKAGQPIAYLAIEDPQQKWPALRKKCDTAGPFYLVWLNPGGPSLDSHAWPYCIETITVTAATEDALVLPDPALDARSPERLGYEVYRQHCSTCHAMNGAGPERMGPDLNQPMSPTEYLRDEILRQLIRDPSSVRKIPDSSMVGVPSLTDAELDQLLAYFRHMARRRSPL